MRQLALLATRMEENCDMSQEMNRWGRWEFQGVLFPTLREGWRWEKTSQKETWRLPDLSLPWKAPTYESLTVSVLSLNDIFSKNCPGLLLSKILLLFCHRILSMSLCCKYWITLFVSYEAIAKEFKLYKWPWFSVIPVFLALSVLPDTWQTHNICWPRERMNQMDWVI